MSMLTLQRLLELLRGGAGERSPAQVGAEQAFLAAGRGPLSDSTGPESEITSEGVPGLGTGGLMSASGADLIRHGEDDGTTEDSGLVADENQVDQAGRDRVHRDWRRGQNSNRGWPEPTLRDHGMDAIGTGQQDSGSEQSARSEPHAVRSGADRKSDQIAVLSGAELRGMSGDLAAVESLGERADRFAEGMRSGRFFAAERSRLIDDGPTVPVDVKQEAENLRGVDRWSGSAEAWAASSDLAGERAGTQDRGDAEPFAVVIQPGEPLLTADELAGFRSQRSSGQSTREFDPDVVESGVSGVAEWATVQATNDWQRATGRIGARSDGVDRAEWELRSREYERELTELQKRMLQLEAQLWAQGRRQFDLSGSLFGRP